MNQYLIRFVRRNRALLLACIVFMVLFPLVGVPLLSKVENERLIEEAESGNIAKQIQTGDLYREGSFGIEVDLAEAARWYRIAAERGHPVAQMRLAQAYSSGAGVDRDQETAFRWYMVAACQGWYDAMVKVSKLYERGIGVEADMIEAYRWVWLAYASGMMELQEQVRYQAVQRSNPDGSAALWRLSDPVFKEMTDAQREEAMRRARAWEPTGP